MKSRSRIFYRYIVSYALVLILPVALVFLLSYSILTDRFSREITDSNARLLSQVQENLDAQLEQLVSIAYMIQNESVVNLRTNEGDVVAARRAVNTLSVFNSVSSLTDNLITYRSGTDYCFTASARIHPEKLFGDQLVFAHHTVEDFYAAVDRPEKIVVWPVDTVHQFGGQETEYLTLFVSFTGGLHTPKLRTAFLIPASRIREGVARITEDYSGTVQITDAEGQLLLCVGPVSRDAFAAAPKREGGRIGINGENYLLSSSHSETVGWDYTVLIPARIIEAPMHRTLRIMVLILLAVTVLGGIAVYFLSNRQYKPLRQLTEKALGTKAPRPGEGDEMRQVEAVLDALSQESRASRLALEESRSVLLQNGLYRLLSGETGPGLREELSRHGFTLSDAESYRVAVLDGERDRLEELSRSADSYLSSVSFGVPDAVMCSALPGEGILAVIFPHAAENDGMEEALRSLKEHVEKECGTTLSAGLSLPHPASAIGEAYAQAVRALQFRLVRGSGCLVVWSEDLDAAWSGRDYPTEDLEQLQWALLQSDAENASRILHKILGRLQEQPVSFNYARMVCFDVVNITVRTLNSGKGDRPGSAVRPEMLEQIISFDTVPELIELLQTFVDETCVSMQTLQSETRDDRIREMCAYVEENCFDESFSLQTMADHFNLTPSNLSHFFKNGAGQGVLEYAQTLRKKEACRLLAETDEPVQVVGEKVGMPNVSSFIRFFRQQTGTTPGQYRRQSRNLSN